MTLKVSISGVRGTIGGSLTEDVILGFTKAFSSYIGGGTVILGSDGRSSEGFIRDIVINELCRNGIEVIDIGIAPTPTVQVTVRDKKAGGAMIITASHNPLEWNGLKFVRDDGIFLNEEQAKRLIGIYEGLKKGPRVSSGDLAASCFHKDVGALDRHVGLVLKCIDVELIKNKNFKVAIDCCNGAGSVITKKLLNKLGCEIIAINTQPGKDPLRGLEPVPGNLKALCDMVKKFGADIGFAQDPDADRLSIVSDEGKAIGEEYSLVLAVDFILSREKNGKKKTVVTNLSTSRMTEDAAKRYGATLERTKVGEVNVSEKMKQTNASAGGEGNGGIIYPKVGYGRDSITGMGLILNCLAARGKKLSSIIKEIPAYYMIKEKIALDDSGLTKALLEKVREKFKGCKMDMSDGIRIDLPDGWIHVRASNTEPVVRVIAEGKDIESTRRLVDEVKDLV
ncbi:MAG: phosphoglucosamine mutase [Candidatus Saganbacteria bacterium]|nr:phosphoglucosamine mutase [Candidatus Saganbacteria bacterium]